MSTVNVIKGYPAEADVSEFLKASTDGLDLFLSGMHFEVELGGLATH